MRRRSSQGVAAVLFMLLMLLMGGCDKPEPLTAKKAQDMVQTYLFTSEPVYAEVPQKVSFGPSSPEDDFDRKAVQTLHNLERAGYLTVTETHTPDGNSVYVGKVTPKGFPILGTIPSARGPAFRAKIAEKRYDGLRDFERHPTQPTVGHAELVWHYDNPTPFYPLFETKMNKPLKTPFASYVSFYFKDHEWHFDVVVRKTAARG